MTARPSSLSPGYRLDRYELLCPIAQGGMASVWVARQIGKHGFEKQVAIKTILPEFAEDPRFQRMFLDEAHIASGIEHQNVTQILDLGEEHGVLYLVMELVDGDSLMKLQRAVEKKNLALPTGIALRILADACAGLHAAHELHDKEGKLLGVVHRDISPQNILVSTKGAAKLIDFGVAKARDRLGGDTNAGMLKGKIHYMAPEQAVGRTIDRRADIWAMGAILYHILSSRPPYDGPNQLATLHRLTSGRPPLPLPDRVPAGAAEVVARTLVHDPDKRIANALELQAAIEQAMIDGNCRASTADVAQFVREHLHERAEARRKSIDLAISAANERARVAAAFQIDPETSSSLTDVPRSLAQLQAAPRSDPPTVPGLPSNLRSEASGNGTMAALESPAQPAPRRRLAVGIVAGVSFAAALLLVFALGRKSATDTPRPAAAPPPIEKAAVPTPTPPPTPTPSATTVPSAAPSPSVPRSGRRSSSPSRQRRRPQP